MEPAVPQPPPSQHRDIPRPYSNTARRPPTTTSLDRPPSPSSNLPPPSLPRKRKACRTTLAWVWTALHSWRGWRENSIAIHPPPTLRETATASVVMPRIAHRTHTMRWHRKKIFQVSAFQCARGVLCVCESVRVHVCVCVQACICARTCVCLSVYVTVHMWGGGGVQCV